MPTTYRVNEVYRSIQGEGHREGTDNVFLRFSGCNLRCSIEPGPKSPGGFDCDTEFESGRTMTLLELGDWIDDEAIRGGDVCSWVILTGGEPGLQVNDALIESLHVRGFEIAIETNGSILMPYGIDYIAVSPKVAEHCIRQLKAHEVRYVRGYGQAIPKTVVDAEHYFISPAFDGLNVDFRTIDWCRQLVKENPKWKLSIQQHKLALIR